DFVRGAGPGARAGRARAGRSRRRGSLAALRRAWTGHGAARGEPALRAGQPARARPMSRLWAIRVGLAVLVVALGDFAPVARGEGAGPVDVIPIEGAISPVTLRLVEIALDRAKSDGAQALVIQLDTPGGLERSMRAIAQRMLNAEIPVIVYVAPTGARAA